MSIQLCMFYKPTTPSTKWVFGCKPVFGDMPLYPNKRHETDQKNMCNTLFS